MAVIKNQNITNKAIELTKLYWSAILASVMGVVFLITAKQIGYEEQSFVGTLILAFSWLYIGVVCIVASIGKIKNFKLQCFLIAVFLVLLAISECLNGDFFNIFVILSYSLSSITWIALIIVEAKKHKSPLKFLGHITLAILSGLVVAGSTALAIIYAIKYFSEG